MTYCRLLGVASCGRSLSGIGRRTGAFVRATAFFTLAFVVTACSSTPRGVATWSTPPSEVPPAVAESLLAAADEVRDLPDFVPTSVLLAGALSQAGDLAQALPFYRFAFEQDPDNLHLAERYSRAALQLGHPREALSVLSRAARAHPDDEDLGLQRAQLLILLGEQERADEATADLLARHPESDDALGMRLDLLERANRIEEAVALIESASASSSLDSSDRLRLAQLMVRLGRTADAEAEVQDVLRRDPTNETAIELLATLYRAEGREEELEPILLDLAERAPQGNVHRMALADLYLAQGRPEEAADLLLPAAESGDLDWGARLLLADLLDKIGRRAEAQDLVDRLLGEGENGMVLRLAGDLAMERGEEDAAERYLRRAVKADPHDVDSVLSLLLFLSRRYPEIFDEEGDGVAASEADGSPRETFHRLLTQADRLAEEHASLRQNYLLGALLRRGSRFEEAVERLDEALAQDPSNEQALYEHAVAAEAIGLYREAATSLDQLMEKRPDDHHLLNFYGYLLAEQGWELERAEAMILRALEQEPDNAFYLDSLGWVYFQTGRYEEAYDSLISAMNVLGDDAVVLEHVGDTLMALGRFDQALQMYQRALLRGGDASRLQERAQRAEERLIDAP